ncbi:MAG: hypothetical protein WAO41_07460 [Candidatus Nanopelagicales bacterium]
MSRSNSEALAVNWLPVLLLGLGAFLGGGAYSFYSQGKRTTMIIFIVLSAMSLIAGALYAWNPA